LAIQSERGTYSASTREVPMIQHFPNDGLAAPKWLLHAGGSMPTFKRTQVRAGGARLCARSTSRSALDSHVAMYAFKGTWEYEHGVPPSGGGARANTMILKMFNALETADESPAEAGTPNLKSIPAKVF
jgi:hypothetical protein